ncbi:MAG TPA: TRAP transporter TatT component family protein [Blastocatellia bacterium]|nr:TRAP transporter TatT component family protein [Blastocatellia bacterium]
MPTEDLLTAVSRADELYNQRARPETVRESVMILSGARGGANLYQVQWRLSRAMFFLGQQAESVKEKLQLHSSASEAGALAVSLNPARVEGHFWTGVNLALYAESARPPKGIRAILRARSELKRAIEISESYHGAGPLRVLARLEHKTPRFLGGSRDRSRARFNRALSIAPDNTVTLLYAAELALDEGDRQRTVELLERIIASPADPEWEFESSRDREIAKSLLARLISGQ